jgi:hypothetical protein
MSTYNLGVNNSRCYFDVVVESDAIKINNDTGYSCYFTPSIKKCFLKFTNTGAAIIVKGSTQQVRFFLSHNILFCLFQTDTCLDILTCDLVFGFRSAVEYVNLCTQFKNAGFELEDAAA